MKGFKSLALIVLTVLVLSISFGCARNRDVRNAKGEVAPGSVSYSQQVYINGLEQWIYVRAAKPGLPVLLWLDGSPGGADVGMVGQYLPNLPKSFTVVCWDQRGTGRSAISLIKTSKVDDYVKDTIALSELLGKRYQGKIYLAGRGWGSVIGLKAVDRRPDLYMGFVSVAQRVNTLETDQQVYELVLNGTNRWGDTIQHGVLVQNGPPPYTVKQPGRYYDMFSLLPQYATRVYGMKNIDPRKAYNIEHDMGDRGGWAQRAKLGYDYLYPQLRDLNFEQQITSVKVPCFFVVGQYDFVTPPTITQRYYEKLTAPDKDLVTFETANNYACFQEPERFTDYLANTVVPRCKAVAGASAAGTTPMAK